MNCCKRYPSEQLANRATVIEYWVSKNVAIRQFWIRNKTEYLTQR